MASRVWIWFGLSLLACGGKATTVEPAAPGGPHLTELAEQLERDARELDQTLADLRDGAMQERMPSATAQSDAGGSSASAPAPAPAPAASPLDAEDDAPAEERSTQYAKPPPCERICQAVASIRRSADGICRIDGAMGERCGKAKERVQQALDRSSAAGCACAEDDR